jgi:transcriptional regulator with XRE-family HTH domain
MWAFFVGGEYGAGGASMAFGVNPETSKLRELREKRGLPLVVLANQAGIALGTLHGWEKWGIVPKSERKRQTVARVLGVDLAEIMPAEPGGPTGGGL